MANLIAIPSAIVTFLNAGTFSQEFTAQKKYYPTMEPSHYKQLKLYVLLPLTKSMEIESRKSIDSRLGVSLIIKKQILKTDETGIESMLQLCDEVFDYLFGKTIPSTLFTCLAIEFNALCDLDDLEQYNIFTGAFTFTYFDGNR